MANPPTIVLITADDMNWDAVGAFGCPTAGTTPNLDRLASEGVRFQHAHVTIAVCQPSRNTLMTGRYPHRCGGEGFFTLRLPGIPTLPDLLRQGGYRLGIMGKVGHGKPYADFEWDLTLDMPQLGMGRNPQEYGKQALAFLREAKAAGQPAFLMANTHDPHRPFFGNDRPEWYTDQTPPALPPSRSFAPGEVQTPGFLPDLPEVRREIAEYYSSVRRADDTVGAVLQALQEAGLADEALVIFLSDNGMAFPFAKTNCYLNRWTSSISSPGLTCCPASWRRLGCLCLRGWMVTLSCRCCLARPRQAASAFSHNFTRPLASAITRCDVFRAGVMVISGIPGPMARAFFAMNRRAVELLPPCRRPLPVIPRWPPEWNSSSSARRKNSTISPPTPMRCIIWWAKPNTRRSFNRCVPNSKPGCWPPATPRWPLTGSATPTPPASNCWSKPLRSSAARADQSQTS
jgi:hypothetical protein